MTARLWTLCVSISKKAESEFKDAAGMARMREMASFTRALARV